MGCLLALLGLITPRFVILAVWLFTDYLSRGFGSWLWPMLGFFLLPATTLTYAVAQNAFGGVRGWGLLVVILGVIADAGLYGGGAKGRERRSA